MRDLHYMTIVTERHSIRVATWTEDDGCHYRITVDGTVRDEGLLEGLTP